MASPGIGKSSNNGGADSEHSDLEASAKEVDNCILIVEIQSIEVKL